MTVLNETVTKIRAFTTKNVHYLDNSDLRLQLLKGENMRPSRQGGCLASFGRFAQVRSPGRKEDSRSPSFSFLADQRSTARTPREVLQAEHCALERGKTCRSGTLLGEISWIEQASIPGPPCRLVYGICPKWGLERHKRPPAGAEHRPGASTASPTQWRHDREQHRSQ